MSDEFALRLHAYADGELDAAAARAVEAHLETCAECRASLKDIRTLKAAVKQIHWGQVPPGDLGESVRKRMAADRALRLGMWSGGGLLAACLTGAFLLFGPSSPVDDVVRGHVRTLEGRAGESVAASDRVKPWLLARLDFAPPVLKTAGDCTLMGARTDRVGKQKASALTYRCGAHTVDFYAIAGNGRTDASPLVLPHVLRSDRYRVVGWQRGKLTCFAVSDAPEADILALARYIESHAADG